MIPIGQLDNARAAQAFIDYLRGIGIDCEPVLNEQGVMLVIHQVEQETQAKAEFERFLAEPYAERYLQASWASGDTKAHFDYGAAGLGLAQHFITQSGPLTLGIFAISLLLFAMMNLGLLELVYTSLSFFGATQESDLIQVWRVFTPTLLHFSLMHIMFNLLWWWYLGGKIELRLGAPKLLVLLLVAGTLPNILQYFISGPNFGGLSGVVYALVGYTWLMGKRRPQSGLQLPDSYMGFMMLWLVLGFTDLLGMPIANGAHLGGLLIGLTQAAFDSRKIKYSN
ncbi:rhomboid family intramembrane serine protease GlpG [Shewanella sp. SR44-3]|uniref:rhomboid family intramembrane serine protease GlpG n=2 Tax=unclassified Shewanella TaxID=196818 RepID=UPI0015FC5D80|nr:rhomboid family intramembrane serine protease GlpG [Shewanella sp. SR44-3]MBB1268417.1 rhomboid family intramembrane serine protease GlpG [Shewanella sp. SR44-3]